ncbi:hypothetical protein [Winogradskyella aurantiaca]|uniref:hypothetical protein n=1 Tax=Winogradskyella aurantiaca TaxID=2219558 RepID=UPI000E1CFFE4|nr:hypothetical protein [Winogradskyella aurantiaca]
MNNPTRKNQEEVYRNLYENHKGTSMAVSSESQAHKRLRFNEICGIFENEQEKFTVHDVGMGLAQLYEFMLANFSDLNWEYSGTEILHEYVTECRNKYPDINFYNRDLAVTPGEDYYDYLLLSGVFHQRRESKIGDWERFSQNILRNAFHMCKKGISFNFISPFVDFYQTQVYYANLPKLLNFIIDDLGRFFVLKHNYALYEFTVYVYKESYIKGLHPDSEFKKYFKVEE